MRPYIFLFVILIFLCTLSSASATICGTYMTDNGNGTVTDSSTGLTWKQCLAGLSGVDCTTGSASILDWAGALALDDGTWRLANIKELQSVVEYANYGPAINTTCFPSPVGTSNVYVWSSSPVASTPANSWVIDFKDGLFLNVISQSSPLVDVNVRLVCDGDSAACSP